MDGQPVRVGHIHRHKIYLAFHQTRDEMHVTGKPVELGNYEGGAALPTLFQRFGKLRAVVLPAALHFHIFGGDLPALADKLGDGLALRIHA